MVVIDMNISTTETTGISLRDHFAGLAIQGILLLDPEDRLSYKECAMAAYAMTDAMLAFREVDNV